MPRMTVATLAAAALATLTAHAALADSYLELEHARANARAGGPIAESDAELLERWGCTSGTKSEFCKKVDRGERPTLQRVPKPPRRERPQ